MEPNQTKSSRDVKGKDCTFGRWGSRPKGCKSRTGCDAAIRSRRWPLHYSNGLCISCSMQQEQGSLVLAPPPSWYSVHTPSPLPLRHAYITGAVLYGFMFGGAQPCTAWFVQRRARSGGSAIAWAMSCSCSQQANTSVTPSWTFTVGRSR